MNGDGAEATEAAEASAATEPDAAESAAVELETNGDAAPPEPAPKEAAVEGADAAADSAEEAGYVPMSEWLEDFDRSRDGSAPLRYTPAARGHLPAFSASESAST